MWPVQMKVHPTIQSLHWWHSFATKHFQRLQSWCRPAALIVATCLPSKVTTQVLMLMEPSTPPWKPSVTLMAGSGNLKLHRYLTSTTFLAVFPMMSKRHSSLLKMYSNLQVPHEESGNSTGSLVQSRICRDCSWIHSCISYCCESDQERWWEYILTTAGFSFWGPFWLLPHSKRCCKKDCCHTNT